MSAPPVEDHPQRTEPEHLRLGAIVFVGAIALIVFAFATWWAAWILDANTHRFQPQGPARAPTEIGKPEIGIVNQRLFELEDVAAVSRAEQLKRLESLGWVDRDAGVVHIPIEQAMEAVVRESTP